MDDTEPRGGLLLVVDMQAGFLQAINDSETLIRRVQFAISATRLLGWPIRFTEQVPDKLGATIPELETRDGEVFAKTAFSAFGAEGLLDSIREAGATHLLLAGIETPICVYQSVVDALREDLAVTVLADGVGARRTADAGAALAELRSAGCHVVPAETVFYSLIRDAKHPRFRDFTALVKAASA
ncbi:MAG: isochorismatase family protein [Opitutales bacterium]